MEIYSHASSLFGLVTLRNKGIGAVSRRALSSINLVRDKNLLESQLQICVEEEKQGLQTLLDSVKMKLRNIRRTESKREEALEKEESIQGL